MQMHATSAQRQHEHVLCDSKKGNQARGGRSGPAGVWPVANIGGEIKTCSEWLCTTVHAMLDGITAAPMQHAAHTLHDAGSDFSS